ncbi:hypothetical protein PAXRUDRAFT_173522 [Paxillus rubicundulus Ve08.2h10]|uniref:Uncharacterized protein n=1 Tax=Paxillus rubicundulus Ve08.2h10 TaxID=930991 RepID=A0A0D0BUT2_9AGAM|nr:hypothetical protein PAXRUDRAFT_173522 [Paxillus rubicundulus Ve08.2h10]
MLHTNYSQQVFPDVRLETAFTFDVLDHYHIDNLECKKTPMSFFAKLRRLTFKGTPVLVRGVFVYSIGCTFAADILVVQDHYRELM